ncbi:hypothetical protein ACFU9F_36490 [Streptomyces zhihengii]|uniref:hypothetical protein n=1 Tax=Streptomyces zhihengii TaxID=1818004 RepID=UPI00368AC96A
MATGHAALDVEGAVGISGRVPDLRSDMENLAFTPIGDSMTATITLGVIAVVGVAVGTMFRQRRDGKKGGR